MTTNTRSTRHENVTSLQLSNPGSTVWVLDLTVPVVFWSSVVDTIVENSSSWVNARRVAWNEKKKKKRIPSSLPPRVSSSSLVYQRISQPFPLPFQGKVGGSQGPWSSPSVSPEGENLPAYYDLEKKKKREKQKKILSTTHGSSPVCSGGWSRRPAAGRHGTRPAPGPGPAGARAPRGWAAAMSRRQSGSSENGTESSGLLSICARGIISLLVVYPENCHWTLEFHTVSLGTAAVFFPPSCCRVLFQKDFM